MRWRESMSNIRRDGGLKLPSGLMTAAVQLQLASVGSRIGIKERLQDRDGAAIFTVCLNRETGRGRGELAVPYMAHEGRTVIIGMLLAIGSGRKATWHAGGRPCRGTSMVGYYGVSGEHCAVRWCQSLIDRRRALLSAEGFTFSNVESLAGRREREVAVLSHGGEETPLPRTDLAEKLAVALSDGHAACSKSDADAVAGLIASGLQLVTVANEASVGLDDQILLMPRAMDLGEEAASNGKSRRLARRRLAA